VIFARYIKFDLEGYELNISSFLMNFFVWFTVVITRFGHTLTGPYILTPD